MIEKFEIPRLDKEELLSKLNSARYPQELDDDTNVNWNLGTPTWAVKQLVEKWKNDFDWEQKRQELHQWNHYKTNINNLNIHFIHEISTQENAVPLILLHGWPSTFYEFHKMIQPLRDGPQPFHVIIPSLPGYGFSDPPTKDGCDFEEMAEIFHKLMVSLGYNKYMVYGTDWGSMIGRDMSLKYSDHVIGHITNMPMGRPPMPNIYNLMHNTYAVLMFILSLFLGFERIYGKDNVKGLATFTYANADKDDSAGYRAIQSTRPYSFAYGVTDSPVGLLSWILEAYHSWSYFPSEEAAQTSSLPDQITADELLTQVTIYWITNTMSSSIRLYYEAKKENMKKLNVQANKYLKVPFGVSYFEGESIFIPQEWLAVNGNLVLFEKHKIGGHFPGLEATDTLVKDIQKFRAKVLSKNDSLKKTN